MQLNPPLLIIALLQFGTWKYNIYKIDDCKIINIPLIFIREMG